MEMKAIIIDDEKHVREGLLLLAEWEKFGIHEVIEARDGEEAKDLIEKHHPEIIFTDMNMPHLDGIQLLKWLNEKEMDSKTIVISGYDDFHYMRNAITYGSFDYLLKPIEPDQLNETLERAINEWRKQALKRESTLETTRVMNEVKPLYWDHIFSSLITNTTISPDVFDKIEKEFEVRVHEVPCTVSFLLLNSRILNKFEDDRNLMFFTLLNICNEIVLKHKSGFCFRNINKENEIIILLWQTKNERQIVETIQAEIYKFCQIRPMCAIGKSAQKIMDSYHYAQKAMFKSNLIEANKTANIMTYDSIQSTPSLHLFDHSEDIKWSLQSGSTEQMDDVIDRIFHNLTVLSLEQIHLWEDQFELLRKNWLKEYNINEDASYYKGNDYWEVDGSFSFKKFKEEKRKQFHELISLLHNVKYQKEKNNIQEIEAFLRENYEKDITLQEIAERFYLSREYISRKFKQQYNETITNYVTTIRIEKAKELLENPHLKVYEIAFKVGYQNEKYFSKVFKKLVGLTPNEYRVKVTK
jgi:two-component system, response regulator YesN